MTRQQVRNLVEHIIEARCPPDDEPLVMKSLQQLEFIFAVEDETGFRHEIPEDVDWKCVNDVVKWLEEKGECKPEPQSVHSKSKLP